MSEKNNVEHMLVLQHNDLPFVIYKSPLLCDISHDSQCFYLMLGVLDDQSRHVLEQISIEIFLY